MAYEYVLLPPTVQDVLPPFSEKNKLYFTMGNCKFLDSDENGHIKTIQICIQQQDKKTKEFKPPIYKLFSATHQSQSGTLSVVTLKNSAVNGDHYIFIPNSYCPTLDTFYKIQIRWSKISINTFEKIGVKDSEFSEWSKICLVQRITKPSIRISSPFYYEIQGNSQKAHQFSFSPYKITGYLHNKSELEQILKSVNISIYDATDVDYPKLILSSGEIAPYSKTGFAYVLPKQLKQSIKYKMVISYITQSGYFDKEQCYFISISRGANDNPASISLIANQELGKIKVVLYIKKTENYEGNFIIRRTSDQSQFTEWEDIQIIQFCSHGDEKNTTDVEINNILYDVYEWEDKTIDCGVYYKYGAAPLKKNGWRGTFNSSTSISCRFEDIYLMGDNKQLRIKFDPVISNLKQNFSENLQTTLGSKYPFVTRQGHNQYKTFTLGGLITSYMDTYNRSCVNVYQDSLGNRSMNNSKLVFFGKTDYFGRLVDEKTGNLIKDSFNNYIYINKVMHDNDGYLCYTNGQRIYNQNGQALKKYTILKFNNKTVMGSFQAFENNEEIQDFTSKEQLYNKGFLYENEASDNSPFSKNNLYNFANDVQQYEDVLYEKFFREKVFEFLNKNSVKLFRSNTEGTMLIKLMNVSLTPKQELGRMLYSFSAEAVEIDDYSILNCDKYNIQSIGRYKEISHVETVAGQVMQTFTSEDILNPLNRAITNEGIDIIQMILEKYRNNWKYQPCIPTNAVELQSIKTFHNMYDFKSEEIQSLKIEIYSPPGLIYDKEYQVTQQKNSSNKNIFSGYLLSLDYKNRDSQRVAIKANLQRKDADISQVNKDGLRARDKQFIYTGTYCIQNPSQLQHLLLLLPPIIINDEDDTLHLGITVNVEYIIKINVKQYDSIPIQSNVSTNVGQLTQIFNVGEDIIKKIKNNYHYYLGTNILNIQQAVQQFDDYQDEDSTKTIEIIKNKKRETIQLSSISSTLREMSNIFAMSFDTSNLNAVLKVKTTNYLGVPTDGEYNDLETHILNMGYLKLSDINLDTFNGITFNSCCFAGVLLSPTLKTSNINSEDLTPENIKTNYMYPRQDQYIQINNPDTNDGTYIDENEVIEKNHLIPNGVYKFSNDKILQAQYQAENNNTIAITNESIYIDYFNSNNNALILQTDTPHYWIYYKNKWYPFSNDSKIVSCPVQAIVNYLYEGGQTTYQLIES